MKQKETKPRSLRKTLLTLGLCAALIVGFIAGCTTPPEAAQDETTDLVPVQETGLKLNLYQPHPAQAALWQSLAADYKTLTGVDVNVISPKTGAPATELKEALTGEGDKPALFLFTNPREYKAWQDNAMNLGDGQVFQHLIDPRLALVANGKTVGLPLGIEAFGIIYNKTIMSNYFELENKATDYKSMDDIKTHKDLEALVKDLNNHKTELGIDGVFSAPALKAGEGAAWTTRLLSVPMGYEIEKEKIDVTGDKIDELSMRYDTGYHSFYDMMLGYSTADKTKLDTRAYADAVKEFASGKAAMILGSMDFNGHLNSAVGQSVNAEQCQFIPAFMNLNDVQNQGLTYEAVEYIAINGKLEQEEKQAAGEFLNWLVTSEKGMDFLANQLNLLAPYDTITEETMPKNPLANCAMEWLKKEGVSSAVSYSVLSPGEEFRDEVMAKGLVAYAKGESNWDKFKTDLQKGWAEFRAKVDENY